MDTTQDRCSGSGCIRSSVPQQAFCFGKLMCKLTGGKVNPLIGSAGVSAVPMAARVSQKVGAEADPTNFLLMHAMGPNVAGVIGTAVAAGTFMAIFGVKINHCMLQQYELRTCIIRR